MARELKTSEEIRAAIQTMIDEARLNDPCNVCCAPLPNRLQQPDHNDCNWAVNALYWCPPDCMTRVDGFVARAQELYNLE